MFRNIFSTSRQTLLFVSVLLLSSCVRERDTDTDMAADLTIHETFFNDAVDIANDAATKNTGELLSNHKTRGYCASITHDQNSNPRTITIDFGNVNCMCNDGRNRRGKIEVSYDGNYSDSGSVHKISFSNYYINDHYVLGTCQVENKGKNGAGQPYYTNRIEAKLLKPGFLDTLYYDANRTLTWVQGSETPVWGDDIYQITGTASGRNALKTFYAATITEPLINDVLGCRYFAKGKMEMQPQGKALRTIDFGNGNCDQDATVTINNKVFNIKL
jgi:hypothetical protein